MSQGRAPILAQNEAGEKNKTGRKKTESGKIFDPDE
jgi:hypothetical protein